MLINDYRDRRRVFDTCLSNAMQKLCMGAVMLAISSATFEIPIQFDRFRILIAGNNNA